MFIFFYGMILILARVLDSLVCVQTAWIQQKQESFLKEIMYILSQLIKVFNLSKSKFCLNIY